ncbi:class I SAM-dependent methyltransferase [Methanoplanus sp. FWC-SCC4]|uniref:Class I SAM-dependent methyltransferase n=1 Tax=Methanochimaera problematica TaxID=2609417 RepID=A0AA97FA62_9EURY|nr:methyltransferase domain-containing protein [Methanoplanus sp. FWC-SCC4]WOF15397.1 class I SAM-dependent methyltransferase [Methanoplanus sp. FWC-SCC4]
MNIPDKYINGEYLKDNPTWDTEDSQWKAEQILKIIKRNNLQPKFICEVGCGAGEILKILQNKLNDNCEYTGYEISPQAYNICKEKENNHLKFELKDFLLEKNKQYDIIMLIDLIEHLEDYFTYLRIIKPQSEYKILHVPLEFFALSALYQSFILNQRKKVGHLHYFTKDIVIQTLTDLNYEIVDYFYTPGYSLGHDYGLKDRLINIPRKYMYPINKDLTVKLFGGYSLMVLVR